MQAGKKSRRIGDGSAKAASPALSSSSSDANSGLDEPDKENGRRQDMQGTRFELYGSGERGPEDDELMQLLQDTEQQAKVPNPPSMKNAGGRKLTRITKRALVLSTVVPDNLEDLEDD